MSAQGAQANASVADEASITGTGGDGGMISAEQAARYAATTRQILVESQGIIEHSHFVYDSGRHGSGWIDKDVVNEHTDRKDGLCTMLAEVVRDRDAEVVCGPATGRLIVSQWTAHALGVLSVFSEHGEQPADAPGGALRGPFILRRSYDNVVAGKRVVVVDDVINTGLAIRQTVQAVQQSGGQVVGGPRLSPAATRARSTAASQTCAISWNTRSPRGRRPPARCARRVCRSTRSMRMGRSSSPLVQRAREGRHHV